MKFVKGTNAIPLLVLASAGMTEEGCPAGTHWRQGNGKQPFFCENAVFQRTTPHHVILNRVKDLSETHPGGVAETATINDRFFACGW